MLTLKSTHHHLVPLSRGEGHDRGISEVLSLLLYWANSYHKMSHFQLHNGHCKSKTHSSCNWTQPKYRWQNQISPIITIYDNVGLSRVNTLKAKVFTPLSKFIGQNRLSGLVTNWYNDIHTLDEIHKECLFSASKELYVDFLITSASWHFGFTSCFSSSSFFQVIRIS